MRVLLYIEPVPVRDVPTAFADVARRVLPMLDPQPGVDIRMFANGPTFEALGEAELAPHAARLIRATPEEDAMILGRRMPWDEGGMSRWADLMAGEGEVTEDHLSLLRRLWRAFPFDVLVHWGENGAITRFLDDHPVTRVAVERGCTRTPFADNVTLDPFGTGGAGLVSRLGLADLREVVGDRPMSRHEALAAWSALPGMTAYEQQFLPVSADLNARLRRAGRLAYLSLPLFDDADLLRFSPYATVEEVCLAAVPKLARAGYTTIVKPHPGSKDRRDAHIANAIAREGLREWSDRVIWCDDPVPDARLISISDLVVAVNGPMGVEALCFDKPVVLLGEAAYAPRDLFPTLDAYLDGSFDAAAYLDGTGLLRRFLLGGYLQEESLLDDVSAFTDRLALFDGVVRAHPDDPVAIARGLWAGMAGGGHGRSTLLWGLPDRDPVTFGAPIVSDPSAKAQGPEGSIAAYRPIVARLLTQSASRDLEALLGWLDLMWETPEGRAEATQLGQFVDPQFYLEDNKDVQKVQMDPHVHFALHGFQERRAPRAAIPGAGAEETLALLKQAASGAFGVARLPTHPLPDEAEAERQRHLEAISAKLGRSRNRIAVVAHLSYRDLVPEILSHLAAIEEAFDLIVTVPDWGARAMIETVRAAYPDAAIYPAAPRGGDAGPFLDILPILLGGTYDAVLKLRTKRDVDASPPLPPEQEALWRGEVLSALLGSPARVSAALNLLREDPDVRMVAPAPYLASLTTDPAADGGDLADLLLDGTDGRMFAAGSMFWVRPSCLAPLTALSAINFPPGDETGDDTLLQVVERLFGAAAAQGAGQIAAASVDPAEPIERDGSPASIDIGTHLATRSERKRTV